MTVSGKTIGEEADAAVETRGQEVVRPVDRPLKPTGGLVILRGNLAPDGCVVKVAGHDFGTFRGPARVFEAEEARVRSRAGRPHQGWRCRRHPPRRARRADPACARCSASRPRSSAPVLAIRSRSITDGRFSGATHGLMAGHVAPEAAAGGPIAAVRDGDLISFDLPARTLSVERGCCGDGGAAGAVARAPAPVYDRRDGEVRATGFVGCRGRDYGVLTRSGFRVLWLSGSRSGFRF